MSDPRCGVCDVCGAPATYHQWDAYGWPEDGMEVFEPAAPHGRPKRGCEAHRPVFAEFHCASREQARSLMEALPA